MVDFNVTDLGNILGSSMRSASDYKQDFVETEGVTDIQLSMLESVKVTGSVYVYLNYLATSSFVIDHPVYGDVDSSTLSIDGDYASGSTDVLWYAGEI